MTRISRRAFALMSIAVVGARAGVCGPLAEPHDRPILTISGRIETFNQADAAVFDRPMLEALGMQQFKTKTPWYTEPVAFEGILVRTLLQAVGASGSHLVATALNDYTTEIPLADFKQFDVLLALKRDGAYMPVKDKGPLFIVYPYDTERRLQSQTYFGRSAWSVCKLVVS